MEVTVSGLIAPEFKKSNFIDVTLDVPQLYLEKSPLYNGEVEEMVMDLLDIDYFELLTL
jgi:hypothetical protein